MRRADTMLSATDAVEPVAAEEADAAPAMTAETSGALTTAAAPPGALTTAAPAPTAFTAAALQRRLPPTRAGDPLGLGCPRPAAPPDPDAYDRAAEDAGYARSLLTPDERRRLDGDIEAKGYMTIADVRALVGENLCRQSLENGGIDPEMMAFIDSRINYKIFVADDNIYTREGLYDHFPFHELKMQPETVFVQQEIGIFPARKLALKGDLEYVARDVGDESVEFVMTEDLVGRAARKNYTDARPPLRIVKTKIYMGKEQWDDFAVMHRFFRGAVRAAAAQAGPGGPIGGLFAAICGGGASNQGSTLMLTDPETLAAERRARDEEHARREAELRAREEALRLREEEAQRRIDADLRRIESMLLGIPGAAAKPATAAAAPAPAPVPVTSTPVKPTAAPVKPTAAPAPAPVKPTAAPVKPTPAPVKPTPAPVKPAAVPAPVRPAAVPAPVRPAAVPVRPAAVPVRPPAVPVKPPAVAAAPVRPAVAAPVRPTVAAPVRPPAAVPVRPPAAVPVRPAATVAPVRPSAVPVRPSAVPVRPAAVPVRPAAVPVRPPVVPVRPAAAPAAPVAAPAKPAASEYADELLAELFSDSAMGDSVPVPGS